MGTEEENLEFRRGIWLSEQPPERQRELLRKYLFDSNSCHLVVLIGPNKDEIMYQDIVIGGNEECDWRHAQAIAHRELPLHLNRIEYYKLNGQWSMTQAAEGYSSGPLKRAF